MAGTLDSILNWLIPTILILILIGFVWVKTPVGAWLGPHIQNFWLWVKGEQQASAQHQDKNRVIVYE